jgi:hypothetical protein
MKPRSWDDDDWFQTFGTGSAHGWTEKDPPKAPLGFSPLKAEVYVPPIYKPKGKRR